jgi:hypothetical protein
MIWLIGVDSWNEKQISGIVDMEGSEYFNFVSRKGETPIIYFDYGFQKRDYTDGYHFREIIRKYNAYIKFNEPVRIDSLDHEDLIGVCRQFFPGAECKL